MLSFVADSLNYPLTYHWDFGTGNPGDTSNQSDPFLITCFPEIILRKYRCNLPSAVYRGPWIRFSLLPASRCSHQKIPSFVSAHATLKAGGADGYVWSPAATLNENQGDSVVAHPAHHVLYCGWNGSIPLFSGYRKGYCFCRYTSGRFIPPDMAVLPGTSVVIDSKVSDDVVSWNWTPPLYLSCTDCSAPTSIPQDPVTYTLTVTTAAGCRASSSVTIGILCSEKGVYMANAFSPNFDGNNDYFYPAGNGIRLVKSFQVYSRWGQLLFSKTDFPPNDKTFGWNGTLNGTPQPAGTYVYVSIWNVFQVKILPLKERLNCYDEKSGKTAGAIQQAGSTADDYTRLPVFILLFLFTIPLAHRILHFPSFLRRL